MIKRRKTKPVKVGTIDIGGNNPVVIQSMTNVQTTDVRRCIAQIERLRISGCQLVRLAVPTKADSYALKQIADKSVLPIIADIHFSAQRAVEAIEAGAVKVRINPGNIKDTRDIYRIIDCAKLHSVAVRIGVNEASIRDLKTRDVPLRGRVSLMMREMKKYVRLFEKRNFDSIVLSAKSADPVRMIEVNRKISEFFDYPVHLGLTHAGLPEDAAVPSSVAIGTLLAEGIGDTIRVSLAGDPVKEIELAGQILVSLGLCQRRSPELIVCPTCGRCQIDVIKLARKVRKQLCDLDMNLRVAVMGCIVNGPGEAADADIAICAGKGKGYIYRNGKKKASVEEGQLLDALQRELEGLRK